MGLIAALFSVAVMRPKPRTPAALLHERCNTRLLLQPREDVNVEGSPHTTPPSKLSRDWRPGDNTVLGDKEFDLVVFGATGFTGSLVAKYLASRYDPGVKWAIAGRSKAKLESLMSEFDPVLNFGVGVIVADASDPASLAALVSRTRVVITTAGPYTDYGTMLVAACAGAGVHYADLSGEPFWQRQMVDDYDHVARHTGAKVCFCICISLSDTSRKTFYILVRLSAAPFLTFHLLYFQTCNHVPSYFNLLYFACCLLAFQFVHSCFLSFTTIFIHILLDDDGKRW
jgi:hypothetical protein